MTLYKKRVGGASLPAFRLSGFQTIWSSGLVDVVPRLRNLVLTFRHSGFPVFWLSGLLDFWISGPLVW